MAIGYESDLVFVRKLVINTLKERFPQEEKEEVELFYTEFGNSSINFIARFWIDALDNRDLQIARSETIVAIKKAFNENKINIPFPIRTLDFGKNKFRAEAISVIQKENPNS